MNNLKLLLKVQLQGMLGVNKRMYSREKGSSLKVAGMILLAVFVSLTVVGTVVMYEVLLAAGLAQLGALHLLLSLTMAVASIITLITTVYKANGTLFGFADYDMTMSLPVKTSTVVSSRIILLYLMNVVFTLLVMLPAGVIYAVMEQPPAGYYPVFLIAVLLVPLIPILLATILGAVIGILSSGFRHKNIVTMLLSIVAVLGIVFLSMQTNQSSQYISTLADMGSMLAQTINHLYPLALLFTQAVCDLNLLSLLLFALSSVGIFVLFVLALNRKYKAVNSMFTATAARRNFRMQALKQGSPLSALYRRELRRYFASPIYVMNTGIGAIMLIVGAIALAIFGKSVLDELLAVPGFDNTVFLLAPFAISFFAAISCTTCCSISLEGKTLWVVKSAPIRAFDLFWAKIAVNLTVFLPAVLIAGIVLAVMSGAGPLNGLLMLLIPIGYVIFTSVFGLILNLWLPNFDWKTEAAVVKRGLSATITVFLGMAIVAIPAVAVFFFPTSLASIIVAAVIFAADAGCVLYLVKQGPKLLASL